MPRGSGKGTSAPVQKDSADERIKPGDAPARGDDSRWSRKAGDDNAVLYSGSGSCAISSSEVFERIDVNKHICLLPFYIRPLAG